MSKPTVFFSHSSKDERVLQRLKEAVLQKTSGTVEIFLSSDGQSIPLGHNWVHKVEEALTRSALMIVFVTPYLLASHWLFFEAGYAYSKGVQVVPVGILGIDLTQVPPPLGLLQGFNISSANGLNNLIALINRTFQYAHQESFTEKEYDEILGSSQRISVQTLGKYAAFVDSLMFFVIAEGQTSIAKIAKFFTDRAIPYQQEKGALATFGISLEASPTDKGGQAIAITIDPTLFTFVFPLLDDLLPEIVESRPEGIKFDVNFTRQVKFSYQRQRITAAFYGTGIEPVHQAEFRKGDLEFKLVQAWVNPEVAHISAIYYGSRLTEMSIAEPIDLLFEKGVFYLESKPI